MLNSYTEELGPTGSSAMRSRKMVVFRYVPLFSLPSPDFLWGSSGSPHQVPPLVAVSFSWLSSFSKSDDEHTLSLTLNFGSPHGHAHVCVSTRDTCFVYG